MLTELSKATARPWHSKYYPTNDDQGQHFGVYGPGHQDGEDYAPLMRTSREENANLVVKAVNEYEALRAVEEAAKDLCENIFERGIHDNWKRVSAALSVIEAIRKEK